MSAVHIGFELGVALAHTTRLQLDRNVGYVEESEGCLKLKRNKFGSSTLLSAMETCTPANEFRTTRHLYCGKARQHTFNAEEVGSGQEVFGHVGGSDEKRLCLSTGSSASELSSVSLRTLEDIMKTKLRPAYRPMSEFVKYVHKHWLKST